MFSTRAVNAALAALLTGVCSCNSGLVPADSAEGALADSGAVSAGCVDDTCSGDETQPQSDAENATDTDKPSPDTTGNHPDSSAPSLPQDNTPPSSTGGQAPDEPAVNEPECNGTAGPAAPLLLRRLTARQVQNTVQSALGASAELTVADERLSTFRSNVSSALDVAGARGYRDLAVAVANAAPLACAGDCKAWVLNDVGPLLFRRPLSEQQRELYSALFDTAASAQEQAVADEQAARWVLEAMLQSASFLYLDEVSDAQGKLDAYSIVARLTLALWAQNPDAETLQRALTSDLGNAAAVHAETERLLADARSEQGLSYFVEQWLDVTRLHSVDARPDIAELGPETVSALSAQPGKLLRQLVQSGGNLEQLMTTNQVPALAPLNALYGADVLEADAETFTVDPEHRAGLLSLPGVISALSHAERSSPTLRGRAILAQLLCSPPQPPPAGLNVTLPVGNPGETTRERMELHFSDSSCASCHRAMDGIGFALESLDWLGRWRETENGHAIDDLGTLVSTAGNVEVDGPVALSRALLNDTRLALCVAQQWAEYSSGVADTGDAHCALQQAAEQLRKADGLRNMILTLAGSEWSTQAPVGAP